MEITHTPTTLTLQNNWQHQFETKWERSWKNMYWDKHSWGKVWRHDKQSWLNSVYQNDDSPNLSYANWQQKPLWEFVLYLFERSSKWHFSARYVNLYSYSPGDCYECIRYGTLSSAASDWAQQTKLFPACLHTTIMLRIFVAIVFAQLKISQVRKNYPQCCTVYCTHFQSLNFFFQLLDN